MSVKKAKNDPGDEPADHPMYVPADCFGKVFEQEIKEWVLPASDRRPGEKRCLANRGKPDQANELVGLALSGGGRANATFALGACQAMARYGVLERIDYLSTVSGGGYLGSGISALLNNEKIVLHKPDEHPLNRNNFPFRFESKASSPEEIRVFKPERRTVRHLRERSNFLAPRLGLFDVDTWRSVLEVILRLVLNWALVVLPPFVLVLTSLSLLPDRWWNRTTPLEPGWMVWVPAGIGGGALLILVGLVLASMFQRWDKAPKGVFLVQKACIVVTVTLALLLGFVFGVQGIRQLNDLAVEASGSAIGGPLAGLLLLARWAFTRLGDNEKVRQSVGALGRERVVGLLGQLLFNTLGFVVLAGAVLIGFVFLDGLDTQVRWTIDGIDLDVGVKWIIVFFAAAITLVWVFWSKFVRLLNWLSLHNLYQRGLSRAYIQQEVGNGKEVIAGQKADVKLFQLQEQRRAKGNPLGPFHIIAASLNIAGSSDIIDLGRKSDSFSLSCLYSGSSDTGFVATKEGYSNLRLSTAMTISGAAFSPNRGAYTSTSTAIIMTLLNARLGYWLRNPCLSTSEKPPSRPKYLYYLKEMFGAASGNDRFVYLTDGGHFDNSAIYELIRRRCRYIIAIDDAGEPSPTDPQFGTLGVVSRLVRIDFGVDIQIDLTPLMPDPETGRTRAHYAVGRIVYPGVERPPSARTGVLNRWRMTVTGSWCT